MRRPPKRCSSCPGPVPAGPPPWCRRSILAEGDLLARTTSAGRLPAPPNKALKRTGDPLAPSGFWHTGQVGRAARGMGPRPLKAMMLGGGMGQKTKLVIALGFLVAQSTPGHSATLVLPPGNDSPTGNSVNGFPVGSTRPGRYQQVYSSTGLSAGELLAISAISFRIDRVTQSGMPPEFDAHVEDVDLILSTTSLSPDELSTTFGSNPEGDETFVFSGFLDLGTIIPGDPDDPGAFHVSIPFDEPFLLDPMAGNLLLEVRNHTGTNLPFGNAIFFDATASATDGTSRVYEFFDSAGSGVETGQVDTTGLVTQFHFTVVPEPSSLTLAATTLAFFSLARRLTPMSPPPVKG